MQQTAGGAGPDQVAPGVEHDEVTVGGVHQRRRLDGQHADAVSQQSQGGQDLRRIAGRRGEEQHVCHENSLQPVRSSLRPPAPDGADRRVSAFVCRVLIQVTGVPWTAIGGQGPDSSAGIPTPTTSGLPESGA
ncbi:MAG: hypothetical protein LBU50_01770 [Cellulomonas sp.]|nr:hypothetical protein [Cellulomonas sp.]